ncbi:MAG TPA: hypothetical protein VIH21_08685 [Dehalococcoidia bacterium]
MRHFLRTLGLIGALAGATLVGGPRSADAHGIPDQFLQFGPGCLQSVLKASAPSSGALRQEFVPAATSLSGVDVCLTITSSSVVNMSIRTGTAAAPGPVVASGSTSFGATSNTWLHIELASALTMTPGTPLVIELAGLGAFQWRGTCGQIGGACTAIDPDLYPAGVSSAVPVVGDFGFITYVPNDTDGDGVLDGIDNCIADVNPGQQNNDRDFIDLSPWGKAFNDLTWPNSDTGGDACDPDDDNDGLGDALEAALPGPSCATATGPLNPMLHDTDGDLVLDGAECALGSNPNNGGSVPANPAVGTDSDNDKLSNAFETNIGSNPNVSDTDGDKVLDGVEYKYYNTSLNFGNSDFDVCNDAKEVASVDANTQVNVLDLFNVAQAAGPSTGPKYVPDFDTNKNGSIDVLDLGFVAAQNGGCT